MSSTKRSARSPTSSTSSPPTCWATPVVWLSSWTARPRNSASAPRTGDCCIGPPLPTVWVGSACRTPSGTSGLRWARASGNARQRSRVSPDLLEDFEGPPADVVVVVSGEGGDVSQRVSGGGPDLLVVQRLVQVAQRGLAHVGTVVRQT